MEREKLKIWDSLVPNLILKTIFCYQKIRKRRKKEEHVFFFKKDINLLIQVINIINENA